MSVLVSNNDFIHTPQSVPTMFIREHTKYCKYIVYVSIQNTVNTDRRQRIFCMLAYTIVGSDNIPSNCKLIQKWGRFNRRLEIAPVKSKNFKRIKNRPTVDAWILIGNFSSFTNHAYFAETRCEKMQLLLISTRLFQNYT